MGIATAFAGALAFNYFHIPPTGRFTVADGENWVALSVFFVAAIVASALANAARSRESLRRIAAVLGAHLVVEQADDLVDAVVRVARQRGTTYIFMGAPTPRRGLGRLAEPVAARLVRALPDIDVRLVAERSAAG